MTIEVDNFYFRLMDNNHERFKHFELIINYCFAELEVLDKDFNVSN